MGRVILSSMAAMAENRVIGKDGFLPWHLPEDLKHFKRTTMGKPIIMGRKSYESLGKPLPGRANIVISRSRESLGTDPTPHFDTMESVARQIEPQSDDGPFLCASIDEAIEMARSIAEKSAIDEIFITGGGEIYKQTLPITDRLYLTIVHRDYDGDTFFPEINWDEWGITASLENDGDPSFTFLTLERKNG